MRQTLMDRVEICDLIDSGQIVLGGHSTPPHYRESIVAGVPYGWIVLREERAIARTVDLDGRVLYVPNGTVYRIVDGSRRLAAMSSTDCLARAAVLICETAEEESRVREYLQSIGELPIWR